MDAMRGTEQVGWIQGAQEGTRFEIGCLSVTLKVTSAESNGVCTVVELTVPPFFSGPKAHLHRQTTEVIYIASGALAFTLGAETMIARSGSIIRIVPGVPHRFWNPTAEPATCLTVCMPGGIEHYLAALAALPAESSACSPAQLRHIVALGMEYDHFPAGGGTSNDSETLCNTQ